MQALSLSDLVPRWGVRSLPFAATLPMTLARVLRLAMALTFTMAVFNSLPVFVTDGEHITKQLLRLAFPLAAGGVVAVWHRRILVAGSGLMAFTLGCGLLSMVL